MFFWELQLSQCQLLLHEVELYPFSPSSLVQFVFWHFWFSMSLCKCRNALNFVFHLHVSSFIHFVWYFFFTFEILAFRIWWHAFQLFFHVYPIWDIFQEQPTMYEHEGYMVGLLLHVQFQLFFQHIFKWRSQFIQSCNTPRTTHEYINIMFNHFSLCFQWSCWYVIALDWFVTVVMILN